MLSFKGFLGLDGSGWEAGLRKAEAQSERFVKNIESIHGAASSLFGSGSLGALIGGAIGGAIGTVAGEFVQKIFDSADQKINELQARAKEIKIGSLKTGLDPQEFQRFDNTLQAVQSSGEAGAKALEHLADATVKIKNGEEGSDKLLRNFADLGVTLEDIQKKDYKRIFFQIAEGMQATELTAEKLSAFKSLFGRGGLDILPAFAVGFNSKASNAGTLNDEDLKNLNTLNKIARENASFWKDASNDVGGFFGKLKTGLIGLPRFFVSDEFKGFVNPGQARDNSSQANDAKFMESRLNQKAKEKALQQLQKREEESARQKQEEKDAKEHEAARKQMEARSGQLREQIGQDRYSLLTNEEKLHVLKAQAEVLKDQRENIKADQRINGENDKTSMELLENEAARVKNKREQKQITDSISREQDHFSKGRRQSDFQLTDPQKNGAFVGFEAAKSDMRDLTRAIRDNTKVQKDKENTILNQPPVMY